MDMSNYRSSMPYSAQLYLPKLVAFDLDGTIWSPDMYQLWGGGSPFRIDGDGTRQLFDKKGSAVRLLGNSSRILEELKSEDIWADTKVAWVSCTDEPEWAAECLKKFKTSKGRPIGEYIDSSQIFKANKKVHFQKLKAEFKYIDFSEMLFFDNELHNIQTVSQLGVKCVHCPQGMTQKVWEEGIKKFNKIDVEI
jgi:magnesium-dependent phosphatase 1